MDLRMRRSWLIPRPRLVLTARSAAAAVFSVLTLSISAAGNNPASIVFLDVTEAAGIHFIHDNAASQEKYMVETMGSGCGWIDYDNDGLMDLYLVNGTATQVYVPQITPKSSLYRNNGDGTFTDVTEKAGVGAEGLFGMGIAVGDYDNDGLQDLFVTGYDRSILYRNTGKGSFSNETARARVSNAGRWGSSAAWFDYNNDGRLDLIIANYVDWTPEGNVRCGNPGEEYRAYCHPNTYKGQSPTLYLNQGKGIFEDVSRSSLPALSRSSGLGVVTFDYDRDGRQDIFIANDAMANSLFRNSGNGTFEEVAYTAGIALSEDGKAEAGMGTDAADTNGSGWMDVFVTHLDFEHGRLYRNLRNGTFEDGTFTAKLGYATFNYSGFGAKFFDYDNDGAQDLFMANGHILANIHLYHAEVTYAEPNLIYKNDGKGRFCNMSKSLGRDLQRHFVSRGAAVADFDNDGDLDVLVSNNGERAQLLRNDGGNRNHWLQIRLVGTESNRDGVGARVKVVAGDLIQHDERKGGTSYQSAQDPRLHFGLGRRDTVDSVEVTWPSGLREIFRDLESDATITLKEGTGAGVDGQ